MIEKRKELNNVEIEAINSLKYKEHLRNMILNEETNNIEIDDMTPLKYKEQLKILMLDVVDPNNVEMENMTPLKSRQHLRTLMLQGQYQAHITNEISIPEILCDGVELLLYLIEEYGIDWYADFHQITSKFLEGESN